MFPVAVRLCRPRRHRPAPKEVQTCGVDFTTRREKRRDEEKWKRLCIEGQKLGHVGKALNAYVNEKMKPIQTFS